MLSGIASYLFGNGTESVEDTIADTTSPNSSNTKVDNLPSNGVKKEDCDLQTTPQDDEWVLVDPADQGVDPDESCGAASNCGLSYISVANRVLDRNDSLVSSVTSSQHDTDSCHSHHTPPSGCHSDYADSELSSAPETVVHPSLEESWLVTPPACFTAGCRRMETSSMENLLIEHPSMSVYHHRRRQSSTGADSADSRDSSQEAGEEAGPVAAACPRPRAMATRPVLLSPVQQLRSMHRAQHKHHNYKMSRGNLLRSNRVREFNASTKILRRKNHMKNPSGANNNRKQF